MSFFLVPGSAGLESRLVDRKPEPVSPDQLVVGEATLQVLADHVNVLEVALEQMLLVDRRRTGGVVEDRKSIRLNSSHSQISYAVFCLKKKKPTKHPTSTIVDDWPQCSLLVCAPHHRPLYL